MQPASYIFAEVVPEGEKTVDVSASTVQPLYRDRLFFVSSEFKYARELVCRAEPKGRRKVEKQVALANDDRFAISISNNYQTLAHKSSFLCNYTTTQVYSQSGDEILPSRTGSDKPTGGAGKPLDLPAFCNKVPRHLGLQLSILHELVQVAKAQLFSELYDRVSGCNLPRPSNSRSQLTSM